ncbi:MAG: dihydroorotase [Chloroflexi bacterium]|nr:dihydroorotase [Chloroflexota bacterium]
MVSERVRLVGGRLIDPAEGVDEVADLVIGGGRVLEIVPSTDRGRRTAEASGDRIEDVSGLVVAPGFVDLHCHLREPGYEEKETIATGTRAAAAGGFTTVCAMPNTNPTIDTASDVEWVLTAARRSGVVRVLPIGTITRGERGQELSEMADMANAGAVAFSDDGQAVRNARLMRNALAYSRVTGRPIVDHCEDQDLVDNGVMHDGRVASILGLRGSPAEAEEVAVARDIALARATGGRLHLAHISTAAAVDLVRQAKARAVEVTAEVTPHHLLMTDEWVAGNGVGHPPFNTNCRVNPPLRTDADRTALIEGLLDGTIDCIATDHAPHTGVDKDCEFDRAAPGISGLETAFGLLMRLVDAGQFDLPTLIRLLTAEPARVFRLDAGTLRAGAAADVIVLDPSAEWTVDVRKFQSKGRNSPLQGERLRGLVQRTIVGGETVYEVSR